jgi:excisionase family DNA binding protein
MNQNNKTYERLFTVPQVAAILGVNETTVRAWIREGVLRAIALPGKTQKRVYYRIRKSTVDTLLKTGDTFYQKEERRGEREPEEDAQRTHLRHRKDE